ncbi:disease resistance-like protein DSC1 [Mangifera indica]|uniref:disease resistance-like protein DSC1 n=1 Tax=Mangifera indica TaxID=29780 RepID=UPI001CF9D1E0|nr:disease resistance-like protein DSC1 [Mangifera indica]
MASSSSSSPTSETKYDVFLSFRGEDVRNNFTSHLYAALCRKQVETFIDEEGLKRGDEISPMLLKAIVESKISVIIFSKDYASSRWCLDELSKILECKRMNGQMVIPVFYQVDPSDVRKQNGSFKDSFLKHEERFKDMKEKIQKWRDALTDAANLSGWDSSVTKPDAQLVEKIVDDILEKLKDASYSNDSSGLIGLSSRIERVKSLLYIGLIDFQILGILGMGGIGKTTIAGAVFNQISSQFEGCCFRINVREESEKYGLVHIRDQVLSQLLEENLKIGTPVIPQYIQRRLQRKKVFIILDDVNDLRQLEVLAGGLRQFGKGSRIIITTRDKQVLHCFGVNDIYEVEGLNYNEALQLFSDYAFKGNHPLEHLRELSIKILNFANGNPLALKVLGSSLYQKSKREWESALYNLQRLCDPQIYDVLKVSYDGLSSEEKSIFLDIACFFNGKDRDCVAELLDGHYSLGSLLNKSLVTISANKLQMHDLLQEMGRDIVYKESKTEPGRRSRLWHHEDMYHILKNNKGTDLVEGIFLNMSKIKELKLSSKAFADMCNLRLIKFYNHALYEDSVDISKVKLHGGLKYLSDKLRYLYWAGYPMKTLPSNFTPENLVQLKLPCSNVQQLWKGTKEAFNLKSIDLHKSKNLIKMPDLSEAPQLEIINLEECRSLVEVPSSIQHLNNLSFLCLRGCESLKVFPRNIHFGSHIILDLSFCINLTEFPHISGNVVQLFLNGTAIEEVPSSIECLSELVLLDLTKCTRLKSISTSICKLKSLRLLYLWNCSKLESFPEIFEEMKHLVELNLNGTAIKTLPSTIQHLIGLCSLGLRDCKHLQTIPSSICNLTSLGEIDLTGCSKLDMLPENLGDLIVLRKLKATGAAIYQLPSSVAKWKRITNLDLSFCALTEIPKHLCCASSLVSLDLSGNPFETLPTNFKQLSQLKNLYLENCNVLLSLPELPLCLEYIEVVNCKRLQLLPELPSSLKELDASELEKLSEHCSSDQWFNISFLFTNCLNLLQKTCINTLADLQRRIQLLATTLLRLCYEEGSDEIPTVSLCLPGSEIPNWFTYRGSESLVTIQLHQNWCNRRFIGFALCAVLSFDERSCYEEAIYVNCSYRFESSSVDTVHFRCDFMTGAALQDGMIIESDHLILGYSPFMNVKLLNGDYTTASFEFTPIKKYPMRNIEGCKVKSCGVCPLYAQSDLIQVDGSVEKLATINQDIGEAVVEESTKEEADRFGSCSGGSVEEDAEPHPKRLCRNRVNN